MSTPGKLWCDERKECSGKCPDVKRQGSKLILRVLYWAKYTKKHDAAKSFILKRQREEENLGIRKVRRRSGRIVATSNAGTVSRLALNSGTEEENTVIPLLDDRGTRRRVVFLRKINQEEKEKHSIFSHLSVRAFMNYPFCVRLYRVLQAAPSNYELCVTSHDIRLRITKIQGQKPSGGTEKKHKRQERQKRGDRTPNAVPAAVNARMAQFPGKLCHEHWALFGVWSFVLCACCTAEETQKHN